jgi:hypothetical protein
MRVRTWLWTLIVPAIVILDPLGACGDGSYKYGDSELRAAVEGHWHAVVKGHEYDLTITQATDADLVRARQHGWVRSAGACGHRSLVREAAACVDSTTMPLLVADGEGRLAEGTFRVAGLEFGDGFLEVATRDGSLSIDAIVDPTGHARAVNATGPGPSGDSLVRVSPR